jgi:hypothetical protein
MKSAPMNVVMGAMLFFFKFNERLVELYPELFGTGGEQTAFGKQWGGYSEIYTLAQGDITRFESITKLPLHQCMMYLAFESEKAKEEMRLIKAKR